MIQAYRLENKNYSQNGDMVLVPTRAIVHPILNGSWTAELSHPIDREGRWKYIVENAVIKMPSFNGDQLFRVKKRKKSDSGVTATLEPIFYDSMDDCWLDDIRPTGKNGQEALDIMLTPNNKYTGQSDITRTATAYYQNMNFLEALNGDVDQSFVNRWGGEILYDNFKVIVNERVGGDYGVELRYGKNIPDDGMSYEVDIRNVVTRIYPKAYNGYMMTDKGYVDSPLIDQYPVVKCATITFDDVKMAEDAQAGDADNGVIICNTQEELDAALTMQCNNQYDAGLDKPAVTINADMVLLQHTEQYKDVQVLETVSLGDMIHCINNHLDIVTDARVIELEYDSLRKKVTSVVIGDFQGRYIDNVTSAVDKIEQVIRPDGSVIAEKVQGILNGIYTQLKLQSTAAQKVDGVAFKVENLDEESPLYGCMIWGTQGLQISTTRTADGRDWDWTTAITAKGIVADAIITGLLADKTGQNYWNLDTGEFQLTSAAFHVDGENINDYISRYVGEGRTITLELSNDFSGVVTNPDGSGGNYSECRTTAILLLGSEDITPQATFEVIVSEGITGAWSDETHTFSVSNMSTDDGTAQIRATYKGLTVSKTFSIAKIKQGSQGLPGPAGEDGSVLYTWIKYADTPTSGMSDSPDGKTYMGIAYNKPESTESDNYEDYQWSLIKGDDGVQGPPGEDGQSLYTWVKYATSATGANMSDNPDGKTYLGLAYNKTTATESDNPADYTWSFFEGPQGEKGDQGIPGPSGQTSYFHIKYSANSDGNPMSENPNTYIGTYVDFEETDSADPKDYKWARLEGIPGEQGIPGTNGEDGRTSYLHIAYANSADGTSGFSTTDSANKIYIGQYTDFTQADSTDPTKYSWTKIQGPQGTQGLQGLQGEKGEQGVPGKDGTDGKTSYFHIKYSANANGNPMTETPNAYIGTYVDFTEADSTDYRDYTWSRFEGAQGAKGEQGIPGTNGENGKTSYLHIKYSNDGGASFTANSGETPGDYIGQYVDFTQADSDDVDDYIWSLTKGADGANGRVYTLEASVQSMILGADNKFTPSTVTFRSYYHDGASTARQPYYGRYVIAESTDGTSFTTKYTATANIQLRTYTPSSTNVKVIRCQLYAAGGTTQLLDQETVSVVKDVENLTPEEIFDLLTNNGKYQGIYMQDGQLYINGKYVEFGGAVIGGWTINNRQLRNYQSNFNVTIQAPTVYGSTGNGDADFIKIKDNIKNTFPFVVSSDGSMQLGSEFSYKPNGFDHDANVLLTTGGWQIKKTYDYLGYDEITYWDTTNSQENGICAHGPWVVWGGWNGGASADVANYKFVVTDQGVCKAMSWVTGSRAEWKENIVPYSKSAVQEIMDSDVYYYDLKERSKSAWSEGRHIGFVIGDGYNVSSDILDGGGSSIDMYSALAVAYKAIQELQAEIEALKKKIEEVTA